MSLDGYARVSTLDQDFAIKRATLKAAGCEVIGAEKPGTRRLGMGRASVYRVLGKPAPGVTNGDGNADQG